jgi:cysteine-rich repeat protein
MRTLPAAILAALLTSCGGGTPSAPGTPPPVESAACGDGVVQPPEECDDANSRSDDGCLATCFRP